jgi:hypothetical protein
MSHRQVFSEIPFEKLQRSDRYGQIVAVSFGVAALMLILAQYALPHEGTYVSALASVGSFALCFGVLKFSKARRPWLESLGLRTKVGALVDEGGVRPDHQSKLLAWTRSGDLIELVFDCGSWMLVKGDVNDGQWRDVQRLLVWRKRAPSRALL